MAELEAAGHRVWIDRKDIHPTADWLETLLRGIAGSDCFAAVLTPDLLSSDICRVEMNEAVSLKKIIVPVILQDVEPVPAEIAPFQWVDFRDPQKFAAALAELRSALNKDNEWRATHTALLTAALDWDRHSRPWSRLLHGAEIVDAVKWLAGADDKERRLAPLHPLYVIASRKFARLWKVSLAGVMIPLVLGIGAGIYVSNHRGRETRAHDLAARADQIAADPHRIEESVLTAAEAAERLRELGVSSVDAETVLRRGVSQLLRRSGDGVHPAGIGGMAFDAARRLVATFPGSVQANVSALEDGRTDLTVRLWKVGGGPAIQPLKHQSMVFAAVFTYKGLLATGDLEGRVSVWNLSSSGTPARVFDGGSPVVSMAGSPDSPWLAVSSNGGDVSVFDMQAGRRLYTFADTNGEGAELAAVSPDSRYLASAGEKGVIQIRSLADGKLLTTLHHRSGNAVKSLSFVPGTGAAGILATGGEKGEFHLWSVPDGKDLFPLAHRDTVQGIAFTVGDHPYIATASRDGSLRTLEPAFDRSWQTRELQAGSALWSAAITPSGRFIAAARGDGLVDFWHKRKGNVAARFRIASEDVATAVLFPDESEVIITDGGGGIHFAQMTAGFEAWEIAPDEDINRIALPTDSGMLAVADFFGHATLWRLDSAGRATGKLDLPDANPLRFSADGRRLAAVNEGTLRIADPRSGAVQSSFPVDTNIGDVAWHPTRPLLAVARRDRGVHIYRSDGHDEQSIASGATELTFDLTGTVLGYVTPDRGLYFWPWETSKQTLQPKEMKDVEHAAFAPDARRLATLHRDGALRSWMFGGINAIKEDWSVWVCKETTSLAMASGSGEVAVGCKDGAIRVYDRRGKKMAETEYPGEVESVGFDSRIPAFIAAGNDGVKAYYLNGADLIREACRRVPSNLTQEQWDRDIGDGKCRTICSGLPPGCGKQG